MYLGVDSRISFTMPGEQIQPPERPSVRPELPGVVKEILQYREVYGDEVWNEFRAWHRAAYLPDWRVRMPFPDPEYYYNTFEDFAVDWGNFEKTLPPMEDDIPLVDEEDTQFPEGWDNGWGTNGEDQDWYYDTEDTAVEEDKTNWPMLIAIGTGAAALIMLMRK